MRYRLRVPDEVAGFLLTLHPEIRRKIKSALKVILPEPVEGKSLHEELRGLRSFRVVRPRIIYRVASKGIIEMIATGPRRTVYEETYRLLKRMPPSEG